MVNLSPAIRVLALAVASAASSLAAAEGFPLPCESYLSPAMIPEYREEVLAECGAWKAEEAARPLYQARKPNNAAALALAKASAERYVQELPPNAVGRELSVSATTWLALLGNYDSASETFIVDSKTSTFKFREACRSAGGYIGQNAFGRKAAVEKRFCEVANVEDVRPYPGLKLGGEFSLTPAEYRALNKVGVLLEVDLDVAPSLARVVAVKMPQRKGATIDDPTEIVGDAWTLYGKVRQVRAVLPSKKKVVLFGP